MLQAHSESSGNLRRTHHYRRFHVEVLLESRSADLGAESGNPHRAQSCRNGHRRRPKPDLRCGGSHLHGLPGRIALFDLFAIDRDGLLFAASSHLLPVFACCQFSFVCLNAVTFECSAPPRLIGRLFFSL